ncbi:serine hydrolase domain-containing protein [Variovorax sp. LT1R16]|uniref:serine hydrolase domain-containing protein n=1 Tax=Variovorax sp. LT1R16 TaxID=3443728 RepID=UPI003F47462C
MNSPTNRNRIDLDNWRSAPNGQWSFQHLSEIIPVALVGLRTEDEQADRHEALGRVAVPYADDEQVPLLSHLVRSEADALVVMRDGVPIGEWYAPHVDRHKPHTVFSITKSWTGMLAGIAAREHGLDPALPVSAYVDLPADSAYGKARVRDLLDMSVDIAFEDKYLDREGLFDRYRRAMLWNSDPLGTAETMPQFLRTLTSARHDHGRRFYYASPNTDMLGLVIEAATGKRYHAYLAEKLWEPMGAKGAAYITVERSGTARAAGGLCMTARDLARFGQLVLDGGTNATGQSVIPRAWIEDMRTQGSAQAWTDGNFNDMFTDKGSYRSCWYSTGNAHGAYCAIGIHGQWLWIDPASRLVIVRLSSRAAVSDDAASAREIAMMEAISRAL